jgi:radical SAM protein with 4Fe4S-binding SPASM domain
MSNNFNRLFQIVELSKLYQVGVVSVLRFVPQGRGRLLNSAALSLNQNVELKKIIKNIRDTGFELRTGSPWNFLMVNEKPTCLSAVDKLIIGPEMQIFPCDAFKQFTYKEFFSDDEYSDLSRHSLEDCWNKSLYLNLIRNKTSDYCSICRSCSLFSSCKSGCIAQKKAMYGNIDSRPDPACILGKAD